MSLIDDRITVPDRAIDCGLTGAERAVLEVLVEREGRVVGRRDLARLAGFADRSDRRCDSVLVGLRRHLGTGSLRTVRSRGWMLEPAALPRAAALLADG